MRTESTCLGVDRTLALAYTPNTPTYQKGNTVDESTDNNHMVLCWKDCFGTDREYEMAFGYDKSDGEPTVAIMWEGCEHPLSIPITVMLEAIASGWGDRSEEGVDRLLKSVTAGLTVDGDPSFVFLPGDPALN